MTENIELEVLRAECETLRTLLNGALNMAGAYGIEDKHGNKAILFGETVLVIGATSKHAPVGGEK